MLLMHGFLEVEIKPRKVNVSYGGNMGCNMASVKARFDELFGKGSWARAKPLIYESDGSPSYLWWGYIHRKDWDALGLEDIIAFPVEHPAEPCPSNALIDLYLKDLLQAYPETDKVVAREIFREGWNKK
jgi:hypothetical protein